MITKFLVEIATHFEQEYPREGCGLLCIKKGKPLWIPCTNEAEGAEDFVMNSQEYIKARKTSDIVGIVHSHPDSAPEPSLTDIANCNAQQVPYYIFSYPEMELHVLEPKKYKHPLLGREYRFGIQDCFEAARDYYKETLDISLPVRKPFKDDWWEEGLDYFTTENFEYWGFEKVETPEPHDLLVFRVNNTVSNHCGVYLGEDVFYHHAEKRLSCRENLFPFWVEKISGVYRYVT